jgi:hypothetical protein
LVHKEKNMNELRNLTTGLSLSLLAVTPAFAQIDTSGAEGTITAAITAVVALGLAGVGAFVAAKQFGWIKAAV